MGALCALLAGPGLACSYTQTDEAVATSQQALTPDEWNAQATAFYDVSNVISIDITMDSTKWDELRNAEPKGGSDYIGDRYDWYDADEVRITGTSYGSAPVVVSTAVEVKKRGWLTSENSTKPSLKIKFKQSGADAVKDKIGTRYIALNNNWDPDFMWQDPYFLRTCLGYELFREAGLPYSRCNFATVRVNGEPIPMGLYVNVEPIEELYVYNNFNHNTAGNLYEFELGEDFDLAMKDRTDIKGFSAYEDKQDFERAAEQIAAGNMASVIDVDQFIKYYAMEVLLGHRDSYTGNQNNVHVYNDVTAVANPDPALGQVRFKFIPWGIDKILPGWDGIYEESMLAKKVGADPLLKAQLRHQIYMYLGSVFNPKQIDSELRPYIESLRAAIETIWPGYLPADTTDSFVELLKTRRSVADTIFGVALPTTSVRLEGWNGECAHRGRASVGTDAWSIDHKPCASAVGETYLFDLVPATSTPSYYTLAFMQSGSPFSYVSRADSSHALATGAYDVYYGRGGTTTDYPQYFGLIPVGDGAARRYEIQSLETQRCWHFSAGLKTSENNYQVYQAECDSTEKNLIGFVAPPPPPACNELTATDLGRDGNNVTVPGDGCVKVQNSYPSYWGSSRTMKLETATANSYPVPFTWTNTCSGGSGSEAFTAGWQSKYLASINSACATVIDLQGSPAGSITLRYWAN
jgi:hypothetical protein